MEDDPQKIPPSNEVNWGVLGTGCLAMVAAGCIGAVAIIVAALALGNATGVPSPVISVVAFLIGIVGNTAIGYYTARAAHARNAHIYLHIMLVAGFIMVLGGSLLLLEKQYNLNSNQSGLSHFLEIAGWLLTYPCLLGGATLNEKARS